MASLTILRPGLLTTVQDCGRWGYQSHGVPVAGAMDGYSHRLANLLVGNAPDAASLEVTLIGPHLEFAGPSAFAVSGASFQLTLDGVVVPMNERVKAPSGSQLKFGERVRGARAYLSVAGGIDVPAVLGSRSTHVVSGMGGVDGRAVRKGDVLAIGKDEGAGRIGNVPSGLPLPDGGATLRVIPDALISEIVGNRFVISPSSNRMGYRLLGSPNRSDAVACLSSPIPAGAVQLPPAGEPILLMADHATAGGYPIGATVISADLPIAGQLAPGDWIEFAPCSLADADAALQAWEVSLGGSLR